MKKYCGKGNISETADFNVNVTEEYRKILDKVAIGMIYDTFDDEKLTEAMLKLARMERIILTFNIILGMEPAEIAFLLDTTLNSTYAQKCTALKRLKAELENVE
ncbi:MAG: hypothetical protein LUG52_08425 [Clostridia bacterium]|nr:hypothetical protein [Clostridia bacterium]